MAALRFAGSAVRSLLRGAVRGPRGRAPCSAVRCSSAATPPLTPVVCFYADWAEVPLPPGHRFPMHKYLTTRLKLEDDPLLAGRLDLRPSPLVKLEDLRRVHTALYVDNVLTGKLSAEEQRVLGFPWSEAHVTRSLASTGGTVAAMHLVMRGETEAPPSGEARDAARAHRTALQLAGGTHHAFREHGEGFCCFNDMAVASEAAIHAYGAAAVPILILDLDVHQGNGTAAIFEGRSDVITFSMHGANNYPWRSKMRSTYDVDLPDDTGDEAYLALLADWLPRLFATHAPKLVFFQAGVDALKGDKMGRLAMSRAGLARRNHAVYSACLAARVPCVTVMGGGYAPAEDSIDAHGDVFRAAALRFSVP
jgi:acetoin utilization deacetylase AcuC-like enzyme